MSWLQKQTLKNPDNIYIETSLNKLTFREVSDMVVAYSKSMIMERINPQEKIIIFLDNSIELLEIILACFEIGAIAVPISPSVTKFERKKL